MGELLLLLLLLQRHLRQLLLLLLRQVLVLDALLLALALQVKVCHPSVEILEPLLLYRSSVIEVNTASTLLLLGRNWQPRKEVARVVDHSRVGHAIGSHFRWLLPVLGKVPVRRIESREHSQHPRRIRRRPSNLGGRPLERRFDLGVSSGITMVPHDGDELHSYLVLAWRVGAVEKAHIRTEGHPELLVAHDASHEGNRHD